MLLKRNLVVTASLVAALSCGGALAGVAATQGVSGLIGASVATAAEAPAASASKDAKAAPAASSTVDKSASASASADKAVSFEASPEGTRTVTDVDGNVIEIPAQVDRVASTIGAFSQIAAMVSGDNGGKTVADIGRTNQSELFQKVFFKSNPHDLDSSNIENLITADCQVVFGPMSTYSDEQKQQLADAGIAFVGLGTRTVDDICNTVLTIGQIEGEKEYANARAFVDYYKGVIADSTEKTKDIADKPTVMQLRTSGGQYTTTNSTDICQAYFDAAGAINVAADYSGEGNGTALTVSAEQILAWNPQYIFTMYTDQADEIKADPALADVDAVKNGRIYVIPEGTYPWSVRSAEGALTTPWLDSVLHPDLFPDLDMTAEVKNFYKTFYNYELSDEETATILAGSAN